MAGGGRPTRDAEPTLWWLAQDYTGPDGIARRRDGLVGALRLEPYDAGVVLPHERTHAGPKEGRLRLLRATRTHVEPIFLLYEGALAGPQGGAGGRRRARRGGQPPVACRGPKRRPSSPTAPLLIADGHHRYETALAFHAEDGTAASAWMPRDRPHRQDGLTIFPTHRSPRARSRCRRSRRRRTAATEPSPRSTRAPGRALRGERGELDAELVARYASDVGYTPYAEEARAAVDAGDAEAAFLLRPPTVEQVAAVAKAGRTMPQKSTFFYPKLTSGLSSMPLD